MTGSVLRQREGFSPMFIAGAYFLVSAAYIVVSSYIVGSLTASDPRAVTIEIGKGVGFVLVTTTALWWILNRNQHKHEYLVRTLKQILDNLGDGVFVVRVPERVIEYANPAAGRMFGYDATSLVGQSTEKIHVDREHYERFDVIGAEALQRTRVYVGNFEMRRMDGQSFPTSHMVTTFRDEMGFNFAVSVVRDETESLQRQKQIIQGQRLDALAQLTAGIAHDFNNQLSVIIGYTDALLDGLPLDDSRRECAELVLAAAERSATLTRRLLTFAREKELELELIDVNLLVRSLVDDVLRRTLGSPIEIVTRLEDRTRLMVYADRSELERSLLNLAINARDAMPDGGSLTIETGVEPADDQLPVATGPAAPQEWVVIQVIDTGVGIPDNAIGRIFEPFFSTKPEGKGTGLGLSQAYGFVRQCGGDIGVQSQEGVGTTFALRLPRASG